MRALPIVIPMTKPKAQQHSLRRCARTQRFHQQHVGWVSAVNAALLVVAADDGIMPQTREHLAILDLLGINKGAVALTKMISARKSDSLRLKARLAPSSHAHA